MDYVCASCGKMTDDFYKRCPRCNSARIVTVKFAEQHLGPNWYEECFGEKTNEPKNS